MNRAGLAMGVALLLGSWVSGPGAIAANPDHVTRLVETRTCPDCDLRGAELTGSYLRHANLRGANLAGARLNGADLRDAYLGQANLEGADLRNADLTRANLSNANLNLARLHHAIVTEQTVIAGKWRLVHQLVSADRAIATLTPADFVAANLLPLNLSGAAAATPLSALDEPAPPAPTIPSGGESPGLGEGTLAPPDPAFSNGFCTCCAQFPAEGGGPGVMPT
jgi:hypothetical protein